LAGGENCINAELLPLPVSWTSVALRAKGPEKYECFENVSMGGMDGWIHMEDDYLLQAIGRGTKEFLHLF
jgi:hypothetical protein